MSRRGMKWVAGLLVLVAAVSAREAWARKDALLNVTAGEIPNDTGSDGATKMTIDDNAQLGGKALKVVFAPAIPVGVPCRPRCGTGSPTSPWNSRSSMPEQGNVGMQFTVKHKRTTSYQTRVEHPLTLKPGKNSLKVGVDEIANVNGSAPRP